MRKRILIPIASILLIAGLLAVSCASSVPQELTTSEKLWKDQGLKNYDFTLERQAFAPEDWRGPVNIQVRNGTAVSVTYVSSGAAVTEGKFDNANTIDKLFTMLKNAYAGKGDFEQKAYSIEVTYNPQMGYPTYFFIDVSQNIADEEQGYTVTNLIARTTTGPVQDYDSFADNLRAAGATVEPAGEIIQDFFSVRGQAIKVNGEDVQVFEYSDQSTTEAEAALISPDGSSIGTSLPFWVAPPHFYKAGRIIVLYVGESKAVTGVLESVLGAQFAGKGEMEISLAPIEEVRVNIAESFPVQIFLYIRGGLADACTTLHEVKTERNGNVIDIQVTTQRPRDAICAQVYSTFEENVALGSEFTPGETYTVNVNDAKPVNFVVQ